VSPIAFLTDLCIKFMVMNEKSILKEKSLLLGIKVDMTCKLLKEKKKQVHVYYQFSRSGTAFGALIAEA
jgi:hypothetical protein